MRMIASALLLSIFSCLCAQAATSASGPDDIVGLNLQQGNAVAALLPSLGSGGAAPFSLAQFMGGLIFGAIGLMAFVYGKKNRQWKPLAIGVVLMGFTYVVSSALWTYLIGTGLCLLLYFWRDA